MSKNEETVRQYFEGFRRGNHAAILDTLTEDVEWVIPGWTRLKGKEAFDKEIENPAFEGRPEITISSLIDAGDAVVVEGEVRTKKKGGEVLHLVYCDVFLMRDGRIKKLTSYTVLLTT